MPQVAIIDYGVGNLRSVEKAFGVTGCAAVVSSDERVLYGADRLVLPGVGAFAACMNALTERGFDKLVRERVAESIPLLGVCVGMQMLGDGCTACALENIPVLWHHLPRVAVCREVPEKRQRRSVLWQKCV